MESQKIVGGPTWPGIRAYKCGIKKGRQREAIDPDQIPRQTREVTRVRYLLVAITAKRPNVRLSKRVGRMGKTNWMLGADG